jgi:hypothetical protein
MLEEMKMKASKILSVLAAVAFLLAVCAIPCYAADSATTEAPAGISGGIEAILAWCEEHLLTTIAAIVTGIAGGTNLAGAASNRKTRKANDKQKRGLEASAATINNNAKELATTVTNKTLEFVAAVKTELGNAVKAIGTKLDELMDTVRENTAEIRALKRETKANSYLLREMLKESRMTQMRKDEIESGYLAMTAETEGTTGDTEEVKENEDNHEA